MKRSYTVCIKRFTILFIDSTLNTNYKNKSIKKSSH